jgi:tRNA(Arg) A34 adenosine deaminase TadA
MLSNKKERMYQRSLQEAEKSDMLFRHGCVATYGGKIIASGFNCHKVRNHSDLSEYVQCSCHAEINVLKKIYIQHFMNQRKLHKIMKKTTLYASRTSNTNDNVKNSAPCEKCMSVIKMFQIKTLVFSQDNQIYECKSKNFSTKHKTFGDIHLMVNKTSSTNQRNTKTSEKNETTEYFKRHPHKL